ncbi:hypothetical protein [Helicobacter salomonis]|uniref:hypothetical protein n=1 Tax=Helicobacter salomonis TaxID=56878 RepID=UPI000CF13EEF|nr:hypothetical protein [Helicobacter salomonis]
MSKEGNNRDVHEDLRKLFTQVIIDSNVLQDQRVMQLPEFQNAIEGVIQVFEDFAEQKVALPDEMFQRLNEISYPYDIYRNCRFFKEHAWQEQTTIMEKVDFTSEVFKKAKVKYDNGRASYLSYFLVCIAEEMRWEHMGY